MAWGGGFPVVIIQDRYGGTYSRGAWLAVAGAGEFVNGEATRIQFCLEGDNGPSDGDIQAAAFWENPPDWIAVGSTPDEAVEALRRNTPG